MPPMSRTIHYFHPLVLGLACAAAAACDEKKTATQGGASSDAGPAKSEPAVDPNLAAAVREVARATPSEPGGGTGKQPPKGGVFGPGEADAEMPPGAPARLTLGATGGDPKVRAMGLQLRPDAREVAVTIAVRTGPRAAMPTVDFSISLEASAPKKGDEGAPPEPAGLDVVARFTSAKPAAQQPGQLPPGVDKEIAKMSGSRLSYRLAPNGSVLQMGMELKKGADGALAPIVDSAAEFFPTLHAPYPPEPVGAGAYWMVTSRERYFGLDVVAYRMMRVERIEGDETTVSVNTKRYVAGGTVSFPGLPPHRVDEFQGQGQGEVVVKVNGGLMRAQLHDVLIANLEPEGEPGRRITIQLDVTGSAVAPGG
jgi:hypothetical protein